MPETGSEMNDNMAELKEFEFPNTPVGRLRRAVHQFAGKWALRSVIQQQNEINQARTLGLDAALESIQQVDEDVMHSRKQIGELTTLIAQLNQKIDRLEAELDGKK